MWERSSPSTGVMLLGSNFCRLQASAIFFFLNDTPPTEFSPLPLPDALPILEIVLVDDTPRDGTAVLAERLGRQLTMDLRVLTRNGRRSLGGAIADGLRMCRWDLVCVMDADLSHPVALVPSLVDSLDGVDGVVASRYALGGGIESWPLNRRLVSLVATAMARVFLDVPCRDPLSGFFLVRRSLLHGVNITGDGNKPLLEILVSLQPIMKEVPYRFRARRTEESKLTVQTILAFGRLATRLRRPPVPKP